MTCLRFAVVLAFVMVMGGCHKQTPTLAVNPQDVAHAANLAFLTQKTYDPWILTNTDPAQSTPYLSDGKTGYIGRPDLIPLHDIKAGVYDKGYLRDEGGFDSTSSSGPRNVWRTFDLHTGILSGTQYPGSSRVWPAEDWPKLWNTTDIAIAGDPQAQQITHANLFYLLSSTYPGSDYSIPPMGLSSNAYGGHIFWDADVWMLPALVVQHPDYAKPIVDYRFKLLAQAKHNAAAQGYAGAEFPWESADTGKEMAPAEFARERHITADVAFAVWNYYLWTGDLRYLQREGWPLLKQTADYWVSRVTPPNIGSKGILHVLSPDETAGLVDNDAYTNAVVRYNLLAATHAASLLGKAANPAWRIVATNLPIPFDNAHSIIKENDSPLTNHFAAKQADALLLIHPLNLPINTETQGRMLDFYASHTIKNGPAMTDSIHSIVAARLNRPAQSLDFFRASYRPFERGPWDAFSEKRTTNNVYFLTGMAGCVQAVLYGFAGLNVAEGKTLGRGTRLTGDAVASLYADPHLPPGWTSLTVNGIKFRGKILTLSLTPHAATVKFTKFP